MDLTGKQKRFLRALGHHTKATVLIGKSGVAENTFAAVDQAFNTRELVKIKIQDGCPEGKEEVGERIEAATGATLVQVIGHTLLFYKRDHRNPKIDLP